MWLLAAFYHSVLESITYCLTVWDASCSAADKKALQCHQHHTKKNHWLPFSLQETAHTRYLSRAKKIVKDSSHPGHHFFDLLSFRKTLKHKH